ncbi:MAG TPA: FG-GAP-like repeat-containing protein, partial [Pyrinomonadaceae bacterium]
MTNPQTPRVRLIATARPGVLRLSLLLTIAGLGALSVCAWLSAAGSAESAKASLGPGAGRTAARVNDSYGKLPLSFEVNRGQFARGADFAARGDGYGIYLKRSEIALAVRARAPRRDGAHASEGVSSKRGVADAVIGLRLVNAAAGAKAEGLDKTPATVNYFVGNDPRRWRTGIPTYARVQYRNVYPGVDVVYYGNQRQLEYDFVVAPGADPRRIRLVVEGASAAKLDAGGDLVLSTPAGGVTQRKPVAFQEAGGVRREVAAGYKVRGSEVSFELGEYDRGLPLVIDPVLFYASYLGGGDQDTGLGVAVDAAGSAYVCGSTISDDFPATPGALQTARSDFGDAYVLKLSPDGRSIVYATYLGGNGTDTANSVAVDAAGNAYVAGLTGSGSFPRTGGALQASKDGASDAFVAKLNPEGTALVYSTFLGGNGTDQINSIALDAAGAAYVAGRTDSVNFTPFPFEARAGSPVYRSADAAASWVASSDGFTASGALDFAVAPSNTSVVYAASNLGVYKSTDGGETWALTGTARASTAPLSARQVAVDPTDANVVYAVFNGGGVYKSTDGGLLYELKNTGLSSNLVNAIAVDPVTPTTLYAGTSFGIFKSTDGAGTWTRLPDTPGLNKPSVNRFAINPSDPQIVYAGSNLGVIKTTNGGASWASATGGLDFATVSALVIDPANTSTLYAGVTGFNTGVYKTTDGGASWTPAGNGLTLPSGAAPSVNALLLDPSGAGVVYAGTTGGGVYKSTDGGQSWAPANSGRKGLNVTALAARGGTPAAILAGANAGIDAFAAKLNPAGSQLEYLRFIGGTENDDARGVAAGADGSAYVVGSTSSPDFPVASALQPARGGNSDAFVIKLSPAGSTAYSTYLGGNVNDTGTGVAVGAGGEAYVVGTTSSANFPTANALKPSLLNPGFADAFVSKLAADGQSLVYSTYLGGSAAEQGLGVAVGPDGSAFVTGSTTSADFPVVNFGGARQVSNGTDAFVLRLNPAGSALRFSGWFGGNTTDVGNAVAADAKGNAYVVGNTASSDLPLQNAVDGTYGGGGDAFVVRVGPDADLSLTNADSRDPVMAGNNLTYTLTVANAGIDDAEGVVVTDTLPAGVSFVSAGASQGTCAGTGPVVCDLGALAAGAGATVNIVLTPQSVGTLTNAASVTSGTQDQNTSNNSARQETRVSALPSIAGHVTTAGGASVGSVAVALNGSQTSQATTGGDGLYQFPDLAPGGNYTVTPSRQGFVFHPMSRSYANVNTDQTGDFTAVECLFQIAPKSRSFPAAGGGGSVTVNAPDALCPWTASSDVPWVKINSGAGGAGTGEVTFTVAPTSTPRGGTLRVGGNVFTVWQEVSPCDTPTFTAAPRYPGGAATVDIAKGDFNNDGRVDLVLLNDHTNHTGPPQDMVSILLSKGVGGFEAPRSVHTASQSRDVAVGDFNGDGKPDVVAVNFAQTNNVLIYLGDGAGNLSPLSAFSTGGGNPSKVVVADFNGDGKPDLAVSHESGSLIAILLGKGNGLFGASAFYNGSGGLYLSGSERIVAGDFDNDGKQDLATASSFVKGKGDGTFAPAAALPATFGWIVSGDFNKDGNLDLAGTTIIIDAPNAGGIPAVGVMFGDGAGHFAAPVRSPTAGREVSRLTVGDFDGDGNPDLGATNGTSADVNALLGNGAGSFTVGPAYVAGIFPDELVAADYDGDGRQDLAVLNRNLFTDEGGVTVLAGTGAGGFVGARSFLTTRPQLRAVEVTADDFTGDGRLDLLSVNTLDVTLMPGLAPGEFGPPVVVASGGNFGGGIDTSSYSTRDFNGDGRPDLAFLALDSSNGVSQSRVKVFFNNGSGAFTAASDTLLPFNTNALFRDFNGDGYQDLVIREFPKLSIRLGNAQGGFGASSTILAQFTPSAYVLKAGDFNGDGRPDLVISTTESGPFTSEVKLRVLYGDGQGGFSAPADVPFGGYASTILTGDLNGDGRDDMVTVVGATRKLRTLMSDAAGGFTAGPDFPAGADPSRPFLHDLNGDARPDLVVNDYNPSESFNTVNVLTGDGAGGFSAPVRLTTLSAPASAAFADFDGNGHFDVALLAQYGSSVGVYLNSCPVAQAASTLQFGAAGFAAAEGGGAATVTVTRTGDTTAPASVRYSTLDGTASARSDYTTAVGVLRFAAGETSRSFQVLLTDDVLVEGPESLTLFLSDASGASLGAPNGVTLTLADNDAAAGAPNPIDEARFFVRQHYHDFLNREPDQSGWDFWTENITSCGADAQCREVKRINVSAAFFLSIEFQETGYYVYRMYKAAYGDALSPNVPGSVPVIRLNEFLPDTQQIGQGVVVNVGNWQEQLEANKQAYALEFVRRPRFVGLYPMSMTAAQFVNRLNLNSGGVLTQSERDQLAAQLSSAPDQTAGRAAVLRQVAENS